MRAPASVGPQHEVIIARVVRPSYQHPPARHVIRDKVLDEARAVAMGWHHPVVEPRHLLYGLVRALGSDAPAGAPLARVKLLMAPAGVATGKPDHVA